MMRPKLNFVGLGTKHYEKTIPTVKHGGGSTICQDAFQHQGLGHWLGLKARWMKTYTIQANSRRKPVVV